MNWLPSLTILLLFACLVAYEYIRDLRRDLKGERERANTGWRLYNQAMKIEADQHERTIGRPVGPAAVGMEDRHQQEQSTEAADGFRPTGIGPTIIGDRERRRARQEYDDREPKFANPSVLTHRAPSAEDIRAAAQEATKDLAN